MMLPDGNYISTGFGITWVARLTGMYLLVVVENLWNNALGTEVLLAVLPGQLT